jgi:hypothetical protein
VGLGFFENHGSSSNGYGQWNFFDGTSTSANQTMGLGISTAAAVAPIANMVEGSISYSSPQNNVTYQLQAGISQGDHSAVSQLHYDVYYFPNEAQTAYSPATTGGSWEGYHDSDCLWSFTNTGTYAVPAIDSSCTLVQTKNTNFGAVTSYDDGTPGNNYPGLTFTPPRVGRYFACASFPILNTNTGQSNNVQLYDVTNSAAMNEASIAEPAAGDYFSKTPCGFFDALSVSPHTITLRGRVSGGTGEIAPSASDRTIYWTILSVSQSFPAPVLMNQIVTPSTGVEVIARAHIDCNSGACSLLEQGGNWVQSVTWNATGQSTLTINPIFSSAPTCVVSNAPGGFNRFATVGPTTTTSIGVWTYSVGSLAQDSPYYIICMGPH